MAFKLFSLWGEVDADTAPADKKIAGLLGAAAALTTMSAAQSAVAEPTRNTPPTSYATSWSRFRMH